MQESRTKNTKRNLYSGFIKQIAGIILPFITRTIVLYTLGAQYQGISSLFNSILHVLNLADLGFSTAVIYVLYKPIAEDDKEAVCAILRFLKRIYTVVGCTIFFVGLFILPFLPKLISGSYPQNINIYILFIIYVLDTGISYLMFGYKSALLTAMQREDIVSNIYTVTSSGLRIAQLIMLLIVPNFYLYALFMPIFTILNNILLQIYSKKYFPEIIPKGKVSSETKEILVKQIKGIVIDKIGDTARNSLDSIFLSAFLGLTVVAIYDNYYYIYSALYGTSLTVIRAMQASVGNSIAKESIDKNYHDLFKFTFIFEWICGWAAICMCCLYQPFMNLWMHNNSKMIFPNWIMIMFCVYFYAITMNNTRNLYTAGAGLFWNLRVWYIIEAVANILLNWSLGYFFGVSGIIIATIITIFFFNFIARTSVLFKHYFKRKATEFYLKHALYATITLINGCILFFLCSKIPLTGIEGLLLKGGMCLIIPKVIYTIVYCRTKLFSEIITFVKHVIKTR